jgi:long-chain acyl-CoA synthetase
MPNDPTAGHVGGLSPTMKIRLKDCVELNYLHTDNPPRGELQFIGSHMFAGYFKNDEKTKEAMDDDGWVNSGDIVEVYDNGSIKIIDRAKNIFKLA